MSLVSLRNNRGVLYSAGCVVAVLAAACGEGESVNAPAEAPQVAHREGCAHVIDVDVRFDTGTFSFEVSVRSTDTGWEKYADAWEVRSPDGVTLGIRELLHPHETEQPFTRSIAGVEVPESVTAVTIAARDSVLGYCGDTLSVDLPPRT